MESNCKWIHTVLALVLLVVAIWPMLLGATANMWVVVVVAVLLLLHAWMCKECCSGNSSTKKRK